MKTVGLYLLRTTLAAALSLMAGAVYADDDDDDWRYRGQQPYGWYQPEPVYVAPQPVYPAPVYLPPPPPPASYVPVEPGISVGIPPFYFNLPLNGGWRPHHHHHHHGHHHRDW